MAVYFGQTATYDTMQGRFRTYRRMADDMRAATPRDKAASTPSRSKKGSASSTPRSSKVGVTKSRTPRKSQTSRSVPNTPTKKGKAVNASLMQEMIVLDDDADDEHGVIAIKDEANPATNKLSFENTAGNAAPPFKCEPSMSTINLDFDANKEYQSVIDMGPHSYVETNENFAQYDPQGIGQTAQEYDGLYQPSYAEYFLA